MIAPIGPMRPEWRHLLQPHATQEIWHLLGAGFEMLGETPPSDDILKQHAADLVELGYAPGQIMFAIRKLRQAPVPAHMRRRAPLSGEIHNFLSPQATLDDRADKLMQTVMGCMPRFGYTDPDGARARMGEVAWAVIKRMGGWHHLCVSTKEGDTSAKAQIKKSMMQGLSADDDTQSRAQLAAHDARWQLALAKERAPRTGMTSMSEALESLCRETENAQPSF